MSKVLVAVGHGRRPNGTVDPGAVAGSKTEQNEGQKIVAVANAAADRLRAGGVTVKVIPAGGPNYVGTTTEANDWNADRLVEVHHDWSGAPRGMFGFWFPGSTKGKAMADAIRDRLIADLDYPHRASWHRSHDGLYILRHTKMPAVLWECDRIGTMADHQRYGRTLANGVLVHLGRSVPSEPKPPPPSSANITYHRYASAPLRRRTRRQPTHLWNFDAPSHSQMKSVKTFDRHTVIDIVGYAAHRDTGSRYAMTAFSFGNAPREGPPAYTHGFNVADLEKIPPPPPPEPDPEPEPEPDPEPDPEPEPDPDEVAELRAALRDIRDRAHDALT